MFTRLVSLLKNKVINGFLMALQPDTWGLIEKRTRGAVLTARRKGVETKESRDLNLIRGMHYDSSKLPLTLKESQRLFIALLNDKVVAGIVVEEKNNDLLYLYSAVNKEGKESNAVSLLLWNLIKEFTGVFTYLDLGTSYRPALHLFKRQFATVTYQTVKGRFKHEMEELN